MKTWDIELNWPVGTTSPLWRLFVINKRKAIFHIHIIISEQHFWLYFSWWLHNINIHKIIHKRIIFQSELTRIMLEMDIGFYLFFGWTFSNFCFNEISKCRLREQKILLLQSRQERNSSSKTHRKNVRLTFVMLWPHAFASRFNNSSLNFPAFWMRSIRTSCYENSLVQLNAAEALMATNLVPLSIFSERIRAWEGNEKFPRWYKAQFFIYWISNFSHSTSTYELGRYS